MRLFLLVFLLGCQTASNGALIGNKCGVIEADCGSVDWIGCDTISGGSKMYFEPDPENFGVSISDEVAGDFDEYMEYCNYYRENY